MNFGTSPTIGQQVDLGNGLIWTWNGNAWDLNTSYGQISMVFRPVISYVFDQTTVIPGADTLYTNDPTGFNELTYV